MDDAGRTAGYGKARLVLLVVDPYLIHAYWEIAPEKFLEMRERAVEGKGVLRFYRQNGPKNVEPEWFDVDIDLQAPNWYVHLWSPEESLYADLGMKMNDGTLIPFARSETVRMPRTGPVIALDQHFMRVQATERRAEIVSPPPEGGAGAQVEVFPPQDVLMGEVIAFPGSKVTDAAARLSDQQKEASASVPQIDSRPAPEPAPAANPVTSPGNEIISPPLAAPIDFAAIVHKKLKEIYASVRWRDLRSEPDALATETVTDARSQTAPTVAPGRTFADLTAIAEKSFPAGLSSGVFNSKRQEGRADTTK